MREPDIAALDPRTVGLLAVDAQVVFASPKSPLARAGVDVNPAAERVPTLCGLLNAARDAGVPVFFTRSVRRADGKDAPRHRYDIVPEQYRSGDPICCAGDPGTAFIEGIEPRDGEYAVEKGRYDPFYETPLETYLRIEGVETVVIGGFTTDICVEAAARGAHERGFNVLLVEDCCAAYDMDRHENTLETIERAIGAVTQSTDARSLFAKASETPDPA